MAGKRTCCVWGCLNTHGNSPSLSFFTLPTDITRLSRCSQWESLLRKFSRAHQVECKAISVDMPRVQRSLKHYPTGSSHEGEWDVLGMSGQGVYTLPNGVVYKGEFEDGQFHGKGELQYPSGVVLKGKWDRGEMTERKLFFDDGLEYSEVDWKYCKMPDRRFTIEYNKGLQPFDRTYMTADQPTRPVPEGYFDTGDGFYCPKTKMVYHANDLTAIVRAPTKAEQKWIVENCRTNPSEIIGPRQDLYEVWQKPNIDCIETPEPVVASRHQTPPHSPHHHDFEQEIRRNQVSIDSSRKLWYQRTSITFDPACREVKCANDDRESRRTIFMSGTSTAFPEEEEQAIARLQCIEETSNSLSDNF